MTRPRARAHRGRLDPHDRPVLPAPDHPGMDGVARAMFARNAGEYAEPALVELAWADPEIRSFWVVQAERVRSDLEQLARCGRVRPPG